MSAVNANALRSLVQQGNSLYAAGNYAEAIAQYEQVLVEAPGSMEVLFNQANGYYRLDDLDKAIDGFRRVAGESRDMPLVTRARYNLGNCFFTRGMKQRDSDLQKALDNLQTAIGYWRQVLDVERDNAKAARNIEVARLVIKDIIDRINQQKQQQQQLAEKLKELLERQKDLTQKTKETVVAVEERQIDPNQAAQEYAAQQAEQSDIRRGTEQTAAQLWQQDPNQPQPPQVRQAAEELAQATDSQKTAESQLIQSAGSSAQQSEEKAAEHIQKALEALSQSDQQPQQDQQGDQQQQQQPQQASEPNEPAEPNEPQQQAAPDATAQEILDRERKQREQRQMMQRPPYQKVDKDW